MAKVEIERKYLLDRMPVIPSETEVWQIEQGYFASQQEGRLRRVTAADGRITCTHTIKTGRGVSRQEDERIITLDEFDRLWPGTSERRLRKTRHRVTDRTVQPVAVWEIDEFAGINLVLAEIELPAPDTPVRFPLWLKPHIVREVTDDPEYTNAAIAQRRCDSVP